MKGIILAGGTGSRLYPLTIAVNKHLLPVYDKPMFFYPLSVLMLLGIRQVLVISSPEAIQNYEEILGDGSNLGMEFSYKIQETPGGIPQAFIIGAEFMGEDLTCLILGDNFFYNKSFFNNLKKTLHKFDEGALIFAYPENNASAHAVVEFDKNGNVLSIEEKPIRPKSRYAVPGLYFYDGMVREIAKKLLPSQRGELEITDVNLEYLKLGRLRLQLLEEDFMRYDMGTPDSLFKTGNLVMELEKNCGEKIACIEEIAYKMKFISEDQFIKLIGNLPRCSYSDYLSMKYLKGSL